MIDVVHSVVNGLASPWFAFPLLAVTMTLTLLAFIQNSVAHTADSYYDRATGQMKRDAAGLKEAKMYATVPPRIIIGLWAAVIFLIITPLAFRTMLALPV